MQHAAQGKHVRPPIDAAIPPRLFRRHVAGRAQHHTGLGVHASGAGKRRNDPHDAEVDQLGLIDLAPRQQDVRWLDIPVDDRPGVRFGKRLAQTPDQHQGIRRIERSARQARS